MGIIEKQCESCGAAMRVPESRIKEGKGRFCSMACRRARAQPEERSCEWCGQSFTARTSDSRGRRGRFCSRSCHSRNYWAGQPEGAGYRALLVAGHPLADARGKVSEHRLVLFEKIGPGPHSCHWCGTSVSWGRGVGPGMLVPDHLDGEKRNNTPENLVPSCHRCNCTRGRADLVSDDEDYVTMTGNPGKHRAVRRICKWCGDEFLHLAAATQPNKGLYCSRRCARSGPRTRTAG